MSTAIRDRIWSTYKSWHKSYQESIQSLECRCPNLLNWCPSWIVTTSATQQTHTSLCHSRGCWSYTHHQRQLPPHETPSTSYLIWSLHPIDICIQPIPKIPSPLQPCMQWPTHFLIIYCLTSTNHHPYFFNALAQCTSAHMSHIQLHFQLEPDTHPRRSSLLIWIPIHVVCITLNLPSHMTPFWSLHDPHVQIPKLLSSISNPRCLTNLSQGTISFPAR